MDFTLNLLWRDFRGNAIRSGAPTSTLTCTPKARRYAVNLLRRHFSQDNATTDFTRRSLLTGCRRLERYTVSRFAPSDWYRCVHMRDLFSQQFTTRAARCSPAHPWASELIADETEKWAKVMKFAGIKPE
jgi:hypothetical protein